MPTPAPPAVPPGFAGRVVSVLPTSRQVVALTFDAGGNDAGFAKILSALRAANVPATFFLTGAWANVYPSDARTAAAGYGIGTHTYSHPHLTQLDPVAERAEVLRGAAAVTAVTGADPHPLFRFPYGEYRQSDVALVNGLGYVPVGWTVDTAGWRGTSGGASVSSVLNRVLGALRPGEIVLMHVGANPDDHTTLDADALPSVIDALRARGYAFVSIRAYL